MANSHDLTREQILDSLSELGEDPDFKPFRNYHLNHAVRTLDQELANAMLQLGADPNYRAYGYDSFLHNLFETLRSSPTAHGERVLALARILLQHGANPNLVGCNNFRAVDLAVGAGFSDFAGLLLAAGADPLLRTRIDDCESPREIAEHLGLREMARLLAAQEARLDGRR